MSQYSTQVEDSYLRLLKFSPFERRTGGGWRFGAKSLSGAVIDRLIASHRARIEGDKVYLAKEG